VVAELSWDPQVDSTRIAVSTEGGRVIHSVIPAAVDARAAGGVVTLSGTAIWQHQRDEAEFICASVPGVIAVDDEISLNPAPGDGDIAQGVSASYRRSARLSRYGLSVDSPHHHVLIVSGAVSSWAEHDDALAAAWSAPGVTEVYDRVVVVY